ncbi:uncharacterized protein LOC111254798 [Varroa destructor]|uniref:Uncharacterized protein n=1 Tax=Varroa destructor TaxID=109461 RepID=A0A7M7KZF4_VARDE|nr:uncharacterized protein LOC111254798 [Varroa destructor]
MGYWTALMFVRWKANRMPYTHLNTERDAYPRKPSQATPIVNTNQAVQVVNPGGPDDQDNIVFEQKWQSGPKCKDAFHKSLPPYGAVFHDKNMKQTIFRERLSKTHSNDAVYPAGGPDVTRVISERITDGHDPAV